MFSDYHYGRTVHTMEHSGPMTIIRGKYKDKMSKEAMQLTNKEIIRNTDKQIKQINGQKLQNQMFCISLNFLCKAIFLKVIGQNRKLVAPVSE